MYLTLQFSLILSLISHYLVIDAIPEATPATPATPAVGAYPACPLCHVLLGMDSHTSNEQMTQTNAVKVVDVSHNSWTDPLLPPIPEFQSSNKEKSKTSEATRSNKIYPETNLQRATQRVRDVEQMMEKLSSMSDLLDRIVEKVEKYEKLREISSSSKQKAEEDYISSVDYPISLTDDFLIATTEKPNNIVDDRQLQSKNGKIFKADHFNLNQLPHLTSAKTIGHSSPQRIQVDYHDSLKFAPNNKIKHSLDFLRVF